MDELLGLAAGLAGGLVLIGVALLFTAALARPSTSDDQPGVTVGQNKSKFLSEVRATHGKPAADVAAGELRRGDPAATRQDFRAGIADGSQTPAERAGRSVALERMGHDR